jgi:peptidoglycan hydrolase-like protein with peptidoglycan-binding domain
MQIKTSSKIVAAVVGFALALSIFGAIGASTVQAQAMSLSQLVDLFISLGIISSDKAEAAKAAVTSSASAMSYTRDLTVGSSGADVTALQNAIGVSPATGYFGSITKSAVMAYQASKGVPATGYVGPLTRAALNSAVTTTTTTTTTTTGSTSVVVNSGVEGTLAVDQTNSGVASTVYEGDKMVSILGFEAEAKNSDISIQRVKLDLGDSTAIYNKIYDTVYVTEGGRVLAQADLNSNTVVKDGSRYYITLAGFSLVVPRNETKTIHIKVDVKPSIDSTDLSTDRTVRLAANGVRGVDGAGIDQYSPTNATDVSKSINIDGDLADSASLRISTNGSSPKAADVVADQGSTNNELDKVNLLSFDLKAEKDNVLVTDIAVDVVKAGTGGAIASSTVYLYDGSTELDSASVVDGTATFSDIDVTVAKDTTKTLWVKVDIRSANGTVSQISADIDTADITSENSNGDSITESGSASGEIMYVRNAGIQASLVGTPTISKTTNTNADISTTTASVTFNVKVTALGDAIRFGTQSASTTFGVQMYQNDASATVLVASSTSFQQPSSGSGVVTTGLLSTDSFKLDEGASVTIPVTFTFENRTTAGALLSTSENFKVAISAINWSTDTAPYTAQSTTFMAGKTEWRSSSVF